MNSFTSSILTLLLSWMRSFIANFWRLLTSEQGGSFLVLFQTHWKTIFLSLCVGGFLLDRLIYLFRWRPDYVWATKLDRIRRRIKGDAAAPSADDTPRAANVPPAAPPRNGYGQSFMPPLSDVPYDDFSDAYTAQSADIPSASATQTIPNPYTQSMQNDLNTSVFFDDFPTRISASNNFASNNAPYSGKNAAFSAALETETFENPADQLDPVFGISKPEPAQYLHDIQAGFAPPINPQELYPPYMAPQNDPVHPGLNLETFQQNVGLSPADEPVETLPILDSPHDEAAEAVPGSNWVPYASSADETDTASSRSAISQFFQKARNLVNAHDESNPPTIRDLQSSVDMRKAFHKPVFPGEDIQESGEEE